MDKRIEKNLRATISYIFGKYDMRKGKKNLLRMEKVFDYCAKDINKYPELIKEFDREGVLEFYVMQSIISLI